MTAVWDEVVEYEVIKLGIQSGAMFYSLLKALVLKRCSSLSMVPIFIVRFVCTTWNIVSYLL